MYVVCWGSFKRHEQIIELGYHGIWWGISLETVRSSHCTYSLFLVNVYIFHWKACWGTGSWDVQTQLASPYYPWNEWKLLSGTWLPPSLASKTSQSHSHPSSCLHSMFYISKLLEVLRKPPFSTFVFMWVVLLFSDFSCHNLQIFTLNTWHTVLLLSEIFFPQFRSGWSSGEQEAHALNLACTPAMWTQAGHLTSLGLYPQYHDRLGHSEDSHSGGDTNMAKSSEDLQRSAIYWL